MSTPGPIARPDVIAIGGALFANAVLALGEAAGPHAMNTAQEDAAEAERLHRVFCAAYGLAPADPREFAAHAHGVLHA